MASLEFDHVCKRYEGGVEAVSDMTLSVDDGEFVVIVGPSGCGKSTGLRMVAGLEEISKGVIRIGGQVINDVEPKHRNIAMVFQSYALYPHMTVYDNCAFALRLQKCSKAEIDQRVRTAAGTLGLDGLLNRKPRQLSGGQRQRVALGRALVRQPAVFLMDEPLSNLDAQLRVQMRAEILRLRAKVDATFLYVTHDQVEAMTMGDRIVVMRDGRVQQLGSPAEIYQRPRNSFVAQFMGSPPMNLLPAKVAADHALDTVGVSLPVPPGLLASRLVPGRDVLLGIRPEGLNDARVADPRRQTLAGRVELVEMLGSDLHLHAAVGEHTVTAVMRTQEVDIKAGDHVELAVDPRQLYLFDAATGESLMGALGASASGVPTRSAQGSPVPG